MQFHNHVYPNIRSTSDISQNEPTSLEALGASSSSRAFEGSKDTGVIAAKGVHQPFCLPSPRETLECSLTGAPPTPPPSSISSQSPVRTLSTEESFQGPRQPVYMPRLNDKKLFKCSKCPYTAMDEDLMDIHQIANSHQSTNRKRKASAEIPCKFFAISISNFE